MKLIKEIIISALLLFIWIVGVAAILLGGTKKIIKEKL